MKCLICSEKKGKRYCERLNGEICSQCCGQTRNLNDCNSLCSYYAKESYELLPIESIKLTENGRGKVFKFAESLFLPNLNDLLIMRISHLEINIKNPILISINISFTIQKKNSVHRDITLDEIYAVDKWKRLNDNLFPFMQIYTLGNGEPYNINMTDLGSKTKVDVVIENNHVDTWIPFSKVVKEKVTREEFGNDPLIDEHILSDVGYGKYFFGKNSTFLASLKIDNKYEITFDIYYNAISNDKKNITIPLGFMFPFSLINYEDYMVNLFEDYKFADKAEIQLLLPFEDKFLFNTLRPLDNCNLLSSPKYISYKMESIDNKFHYDKYCIFNHYFSLNSNNDTEVNVHFSDIPIFLGLYDDFNKVYNNDYSPFKITIFNSTSKPKKYKICATIEDLSHTYEDEVYVNPCSTGNFNIAPSIICDKIDTITTTTQKNIEIKVFEGENKILVRTNKCTIYPKDVFVETIENDKKDWEIDFRGFLCRWITPNDKVIDEIISEIAKGDNVVSNTTNNTFAIEKEIKAVYDKLSDMKYSIRALNFSEGKYHTQRISLPKTTIKYKSGNCIDLSILMASIFEALKLKVYICLIPWHALVRVKVNDNFFYNIETTLLGKKEFSEAVECANEKFNKHFSGNDAKDNSSFIVDVEVSRKSKIFPMV